MGPSKGVVFIGMDPKLSVGGQDLTSPGYEDGTVIHPFAKKAQDAAAQMLEPTVKVTRQRKVKIKKEEQDVVGQSGSGEQGRRRGGRGRTRRQVDGPGSVG